MIFPGWTQRQLPEAWGFVGLCLWSGQISPHEVFRPLEQQKVYKDVPAQEGVLLSRGGKRWTCVILQMSLFWP